MVKNVWLITFSLEFCFDIKMFSVYKISELSTWSEIQRPDGKSIKGLKSVFVFNPICHGLLGPDRFPGEGEGGGFKVPGLNLAHNFNDFQILFLQGLRYIYKGLESKI